jgi:hypothetical protein
LPFERRLLADFKEDPELMKYLEKRPKDLSLRELTMVVDYLRPAGGPAPREVCGHFLRPHDQPL